MSRAAELSVAFLRTHPADAARVLDQVSPADAAAFLDDVPEAAAAVVLGYMQPAGATAVLEHSVPTKAAAFLIHMTATARSLLLRAMPQRRLAEILATFPKRDAARMRRYLAYGTGTVGAWMDAPRATFASNTTIGDCLEGIRGLGMRLGSSVFAVDAEQNLLGVLDIDALLSADDKALLGDLMVKDFVSLSPQASLSSVITLTAWDTALSLPVAERGRRLLGVLHFDSLRDGLVADHGPINTTQINVVLSHMVQAFLVSVSGLLQAATTEPRPTRLPDEKER